MIEFTNKINEGFEAFCNRVDESFVAIATMVELTKTGNEDLINILSDNGR